MRTFGHLMSGAALTLITDSSLRLLANSTDNELLKVYAKPEFYGTTFGSVGTALFFGLLALGLFLPDFAETDSYISRIFYVPSSDSYNVSPNGFSSLANEYAKVLYDYSHTIWPVLVFSGFGFLYRPLFGLAIGILFHIFVDGFSSDGVNLLYPFTKFNFKHKGLYNDMTEARGARIVFCIVLWILAIIINMVNLRGV